MDLFAVVIVIYCLLIASASYPTIPLTVKVGETVHLSCSLVGDQIPYNDIVWKKDMAPIVTFVEAEQRWIQERGYQVGKYQTSTNSTVLVLKDVHLSDQGIFCCTSQYISNNKVCHGIRVVYQDVSATSHVTTTPANTGANPKILMPDHVTEHEKTQIEFFYEEKRFIHWELDRIDVTRNSTIKYKDNGASSFLSLFPQRHYNEKLLICSDDTQRQRMDQRILHVLYEPRILEFTLPEEVFSNKVFQMTCVVDANPIEPAMITVQRQLSQHSTSPSWTTLANEFYSAARHTDEKQTWKTTVNSLDTVPDGLYRCSVVNGIGKEVYSEGKRMRVLDIEHEWETYIPKIVIKDGFLFQENIVMEVECSARHSSTLSVLRWSVNNEDINFNASLTQHRNSSTSYIKSSLRFYPVRRYNGQNLTCTTNNNSSLSDYITLNVQYCSDQLPSLTCDVFEGDPYRWMISCKSGPSNPPYLTKIDNVNITTNFHVSLFENSIYNYKGFITDASYEKLYVKDRVTENISCCIQNRYCTPICNSCLTTVQKAQRLLKREDYYLIAPGIVLLLVCGGLFFAFSTWMRKRRHQHSYDPTTGPTLSNTVPMDIFDSNVSNDEVDSVHSGLGSGLNDPFRKHSYVTCVDSASVISDHYAYDVTEQKVRPPLGENQNQHRQIQTAPVSRDAYMNIDDQFSDQRSMEDTASVISKKLLYLKNRKLSIDSWGTGQVDYTRRIRKNATLRVAKHKTEELNELQKIGPHPNVLNLYGWNTASVPNLIIFRLPTNQTTLNSYLRYHYDAMQMREMEQYDVMTSKTAVTCSLDVCRGMAFLSSNGFIHPCLNTHQVLVDFSHVCKLFAFTKASSVSPVNLSPEEEKLHEKWLPPEYLTLKEYCPASDVWSFGVLLWEIFSYGEQPNYRNSVIDGSCLTGVNDLRQPGMCPTEIYHLMISCWNELPVDRPSFHRLQESLEHAYRTLIGNLVY